jgi:hypothetical protein
VGVNFCATSGKIQHDTREAAEKILGRAANGRKKRRVKHKRDTWRGKLGVYRCPDCRYWHIGHSREN